MFLLRMDGWLRGGLVFGREQRQTRFVSPSGLYAKLIRALVTDMRNINFALLCLLCLLCLGQARLVLPVFFSSLLSG